jgi:glyoxylase-like metal-dependent hydrolase (beta-lactamase superfamily II)
MIIIQIPVGSMQNLSYLIGDEKTKEGAVIDPGFEYEKILKEAEKHKLEITKILLTHAHFDHITDLEKIVNATNAQIYLHEKEPFNSKLKITKLKDNNIISLGKIKIKVIYTPGHTLGGVCYYIKNENKLFTGDTLFVNSIGRTDLGGNEKDLLDSLKKLSKLPDKTGIYPSHAYNGIKSTIGEQKKTNPFMKFK